MLTVDEPVMFQTEMIVKSSPHTEVCRIWGAVRTQDDNIKLMDSRMDWYTLLPNQIMAGYVASTLLQRLKLIEYQKSENALLNP